MNPSRVNALLRWSTLLVLFFPFLAFADYVKPPQPPSAAESPPDVDKDTPEEAIDCWLITGANMLAAAGYGTGGTVQLRAEGIYEQLKAKFPPTGG